MTYENARRMIEGSSWFKEITELDYPAARLITLVRVEFEHELQAIIDRHARQQVHIDRIKFLCCVKV